MVDLKEIQNLCRQNKILWKDHAAKRLKERNIKTEDVENCIATGKIIEQYPTDYPVQSCLILGFSMDDRYLHIVCSVYKNMLCIITSYFPNLCEWEDDYQTRKAVN